MAWDAEADSLFPQTVTLAAPGATMNEYGRTTPGASTSRAAYVEYKTRLVRKLDGAEVTSSIAVYLSGSGGVSGVEPTWTLTLPDATTRPIVSISRYPDEDGNMLEVVYLQ